MKDKKFNSVNISFAIIVVISIMGLAFSAYADPYKFTFTSEVTTNGVDGVESGDVVIIEVIADNGSDTLVSQQWFGYDVISAKFTAGTYEAEILAPFSFANYPNFETDENGALSNVLFNDDQYDPLSTDTLNGTENIRLSLNAITTSDGTNIFFFPWNYYSLYPDAWTIHDVGATDNNPPIFDGLVGSFEIGEYDTVEFTVSASDPDGDNISLACDNPPLGSTFDALSGYFSWAPDHSQAGNYVVTFSATDDGTPNLVGYTEVAITVNDISPNDLSEEIVSMVITDLTLPDDVVNSYIANVKKVKLFIETNKITAAIQQLEAFIKKINEDVNNGEINAEDAQILINMANDVIASLS